MATSDLPRRLAVAAVGVPVGIGVTWAGALPVSLVLAILAGMGASEVYRLAAAKGVRSLGWLGVPAAAALPVAAGFLEGWAAWSGAAWGIVLALALVSLSVALFLRGVGGSPLAVVAVTLFGVVYAGGTLSFAVHLRALPALGGGIQGWEGALLLIFPFVVTWLGDTFAYFAGHRWGRRKLLPAVSPAKTVEGGMGGLVGSVAGAALFAALLLEPFTSLGLGVGGAALLGLLLGAAGQIGDLAESLLKREAGVKDSGALFPGHGGLLDRFDAIFFTLPVTYLLLPYFVR